MAWWLARSLCKVRACGSRGRVARSVVSSLISSLVGSLGGLVARSLARSAGCGRAGRAGMWLARSLARLLARLLARSLACSLARSLARHLLARRSLGRLLCGRARGRVARSLALRACVLRGRVARSLALLLGRSFMRATILSKVNNQVNNHLHRDKIVVASDRLYLIYLNINYPGLIISILLSYHSVILLS